MEPTHELYKLLGWAVALVITMGTAYKMYAISLKDRQGSKDNARSIEDLKRDISVLKERVERNEKQDEKRDAAIDKLADRVYDQK